MPSVFKRPMTWHVTHLLSWQMEDSPDRLFDAYEQVRPCLQPKALLLTSHSSRISNIFLGAFEETSMARFRKSEEVIIVSFLSIAATLDWDSSRSLEKRKASLRKTEMELDDADELVRHRAAEKKRVTLKSLFTIPCRSLKWKSRSKDYLDPSNHNTKHD